MAKKKKTSVRGKASPITSTETHVQAFTEVVGIIREARRKAFHAVNTTLIDLYWQVGEYLSLKVNDAGWGQAVVRQLADYIRETDQNSKGFSAQNLWRMKQFYETYGEQEKLSPLVRELPWSNNLLILGKTKSDEEKEFYLRLAIKERWSKRELERQIDGALFERSVVSPPKLSPVVREIYPDAENIFKDVYLVNFLDIPESHTESDLQKGLVINLKKFLLELGRDFCFIGEEFQVQVGGKDFYIDLLFFHRQLSCLVAFELKINDFKPEYLGKLSFYLEALDRDVRREHEKPSVGVLLCKSKDEEVVEYALSRTLSPALVSEYQTRLPDKNMLRLKLHEFYELAYRSSADQETGGKENDDK